jgi:hypothetical protein
MSGAWLRKNDRHPWLGGLSLARSGRSKDLPLVITVCVGTIGLFVTVAERALIERGMEDGARKVVSYLPNNLHQAND